MKLDFTFSPTRARCTLEEALTETIFHLLSISDFRSMTKHRGFVSILPQELIETILSKLSVKCLLRFKCVCKLWRVLITKMHLAQSINRVSNRPSLLILSGPYSKLCETEEYGGLDTYIYTVECDEYDNGAVEINYPLANPFVGVKLLSASCNGLFCVSIGNTICFWNPATEEYKVLPNTPIEKLGIIGSYMYSVGYDPTYEEYKVVRIGKYGVCEYEVIVLSVLDNSWRRNDMLPKNYFFPELGVYLNGALHWLARNKLLCVEDKYSDGAIVSFDIRNEEFQEMLQPDDVAGLLRGETGYFNTLSLGVFGGHLCMFSEDYKFNFVIWIMRDYGVKESWTKLVSFVYEKPAWSFNRFRKNYLRPLHFSQAGEILLTICNYLRVYDTEHKKVRKLEIPRVPGFIDNIKTCV
ncbi:hypothetical protein GIB67_032406 [Kingdonia uniflora]|uniref:F-box domain-containing protein n=1 Tax=Kingdonia uniflora TaxID=39325 RepID=A0A7J7MJ36_9MAGN|nr:hypothetical protein GIB67_032406 [Kingdonia uniflora]